MKVVVDTNVLVSGMLSPGNPPARVLKALTDGRLELCFDDRVLAEYRKVVARKKFPFSEAFAHKMIGKLEAAGRFIAAPAIAVELPDANDKPFIEVAIAGRVDYLITGNLKDFPEQATRGVSVVSPREFVDLGLA